MKKNCNCYHIEKKRRYTYNPITGDPIGHDIEVGVCWGTKEQDECSCGGDETKCDFYPEVRKKARGKIKVKEKKKDKGDYVKVVRCKNCNVPHNKWTGCPVLNGMIPPPDFYCAYGKPKDK